jgi:hypothetical protein
MRSRSSLATVVVALGAVLVLPDAASAQVPTRDSVVGSGAYGTFTYYSVDVSSGPAGEDPTGQSTSVLYDTWTFQSSSVDCLHVSGNIGTYAGALAPNYFGYTYYKVTVVDNGPTGSPPDTVGTHALNTPLDCTEPLGPEFTVTLTSGDVVVVDAPALPTSKEQCKNGGWRNFASFKHQGECVSAVATGAKGPQPGLSGR